MGKVTLYSDTHFHPYAKLSTIKTGINSRLLEQITTIEQFSKQLDKKDIVIFLGDFLHAQGSSIDRDTYHAAYSVFETVAEKCQELIIIPGNHDIVKNSVKILRPLRKIALVVDKPMIYTRKGDSFYCIPYTSKRSEFLGMLNYLCKTEVGKGEGNILCGHVGIRGASVGINEYLSKEDILPDDILNYMDIAVLGHYHCFSEDTEYLTNTGWKRFEDINVKDIIITLNRNTRYLEIDNVLQKHSYGYGGEIVSVKGRSVDLLVTHNHSLLGLNTNKKHLIEFEANNPPHISHFLQCGVLPNRKSSWSDNKIRLLNWIVSDGSVGWYNSVQFTLSKPRKIQRLISLLQLMGIGYSINPKKKENNQKLQPYRIGLLKFKSGIITKKIPQEVLNFSPTQFKIFINEYKYIDDSEYGNNIQISTTSKENADILQAGCVINNIQCCLTKRQRDTTFKKACVSYILSVNLKHKTHEIHDDKNFGKQPYFGTVHCLSTKNETLIVRRNGKISITGNSHQTIRKHIHYVGSPYQIDFSEMGIEKGYMTWDGSTLEFKKLLGPQFWTVIIKKPDDLSRFLENRRETDYYKLIVRTKKINEQDLLFDSNIIVIKEYKIRAKEKRVQMIAGDPTQLIDYYVNHAETDLDKSRIKDEALGTWRKREITRK